MRGMWMQCVFWIHKEKQRCSKMKVKVNGQDHMCKMHRYLNYLTPLSHCMHILADPAFLSCIFLVLHIQDKNAGLNWWNSHSQFRAAIFFFL